MNNRKRSHFISANNEHDESYTISIPCRINNVATQGFDGTGQFYFILERSILDSIRFHVIHHTHQERKLKRQLIEIRIPQSHFNLKKKVFFNPDEAKLLYLTEQNSTAPENHQELILNLYCFELYSKFGLGNCELSLDDQNGATLPKMLLS